MTSRTKLLLIFFVLSFCGVQIGHTVYNQVNWPLQGPTFIGDKMDPSSHIHFMTYNVNYSRRATNEYAQYSWDNRRNDIYELIQEENPNIVFLQEILTKNQQEVQTSLSDYQWHFEST